MRFAAHRNQGTYAAAYQPRISMVDGQATYFELDRHNTEIHELFRGYALRRDYNYRPHLPEQVRWQLQDSATVDQEMASSSSECGIAERQKLYDQKCRTRDRAMRELKLSSQAGSLLVGDFSVRIGLSADPEADA